MEARIKMLDDNTRRLKLSPPSRASSFYIDNLLGATGRAAEEPLRCPVTCPGMETLRLSCAARGSARSACGEFYLLL